MARRVSEEAARLWLLGFRERREQRRREADPYALPQGPVVVSFSGGRTSGYLLRRLLDRHGGTLPPNVFVVFRNTGKEREESLEFVKEVGDRWGVSIVWLEYRYLGWGAGRSKKHTFVEVTFETASRRGEPFDQLIEARQDCRRDKGEELILPNQGMRWCTGELKQKTLLRWLRFRGVTAFTNVIGIRHDEPKRWMKIVDCEGGRLAGETPTAPLFDAGVTLQEVTDYWSSSPFDLRLEPHEGNCDLCFLKARWKREAIARARPGSVEWWAAHEERSGALFKLGQPYRSLPLVSSCAVGGDDDEEAECHCTD